MAKTPLPIFTLLSRRGKIISVLLDPSVGKTSRGYILSLLSMTQFVFPEGRRELPDSSKWNVQEDVPKGPYIADYSREKQKNRTIVADSSTTFTKRKVRYLQTPKKSTTRTIEIDTAILPKGKLKALFNFVDGRLLSINGTESEDFLINEKRLVMPGTLSGYHSLGISP
jgi:hypothetical protein